MSIVQVVEDSKLNHANHGDNTDVTNRHIKEPKTELYDKSDESKVPLLENEHADETKRLLDAQTSSSNGAYWEPDEQNQWVAMLFLGTTMAYATRTILPLCAVTVAEEFGWDKTDMGLVLGCFFWGYPVFQILGGHISDKIGGDQVLFRAAFVWSMICMATPYAAYTYRSKAASVYLMALLRFMMGITQGVHFPSTTSLVSSKVTPSQRALFLSISYSGSSAGSVFTGGIGSLLLAEFHWSTLFYTFGAASFIWAICLRTFSKNSRSRLKVKNSSANLADDQNQLSGKGEATQQTKEKSFPICQLCDKAPFWGLFIAYVCNGYYNLTLLNWLPTFFTEVYPGHRGWIFNVIPWLIQIPTTIFSGLIAGKMTSDWGYETGVARKMVFTICAFGMVTSLVLVSFTSNFNIALFLMVNAVGWCSFTTGALPVNIQDIAPNQAGAVYGIVNTVASLQGFIGSYITGYVLHITESWATVFYSTSSILAVGWITFVIFGSGKPVL